MYMDSRSRRNFGQLNNELQDVQRIMVQNIDDVLTRGEALSGIFTFTSYAQLFQILCLSFVCQCKQVHWANLCDIEVFWI